MSTRILFRNESCGNPSFFASTDYVVIFTHVVSIFSIPVSIYASYCLVYKTPQKMASAKRHLLVLHFWNMTFDIVFNLLNTPILFFPSASFIMLGYGENIGIPPRFQYYLIQVAICVIAVAMIGLYENRFSSITTNPYRIQKNWIRVILHIFNYLVAFLVVVPPYFRSVDLNEKREELLKINPCPPDEFFTDRFDVISDQPSYVVIFMFAQTMIVLPQTTFLSKYTAYILVYKPSESVSEATRKMQRKFLSSLMLQCNIPHILLFIPVLYIWFSAMTEYYSPVFNNHIVALVSLHGICATTCILVIHKPYRDHFIGILSVCFPSLARHNTVAVHKSSVISVTVRRQTIA